jgi:NAD(P)-dependent dehydrogenase (short-subunit alcohol dehydrogenase family)
MAPVSNASLKGAHCLVTLGTGIGATGAIEIALAGAKVTVSGRRSGPFNDLAMRYRPYH